jgi:hypothetical protein
VQPPPDVLLSALRRIPESRIESLEYAGQQAEYHIRYLQAARGESFEPTDAFLVPPHWCRRMCQTLYGELYPAYIAFYSFLT